ncbi:MAG: response regulator transcription factor [Chloroflexia bacterium]
MGSGTGSRKAVIITMLLVDDQPSVLQALRECFALERDLQIVGEALDGEIVLALAQKLHPDVMVTDVKMPNMDGITATEAMRELVSNTKVVILTVHDNKATRVQAFAAGAVAFIAKHEPAEALLDAIYSAVANRDNQ